MPKKYVRLTFKERIEIEKALSHKKTYAQIADYLQRDKSTIQRDVVRLGKINYTALKAECIAVGKSSNRKTGKSKINVCPELKMYVLGKLKLS